MALNVGNCNSSDGVMLPKDVTMKNYRQFEASMQKHLPVGTPKEEVDSYLTKMKIEHSYVQKKKIFYAIIPKIGNYRIIYVTSLLIRIHLDNNERLEKIEFELENTGL